MKNVWVLERFVSTEETTNSISELQNMLANATKADDKRTLNMMISATKRKLETDVDGGHWTGYVGRSNYKTWCWEAKDFIRRHKGTEFGKAPLRVVKAQVEDDATTWLGYTNAVVNEGVLKYLYATL